jgi:hypothetical protein
MSRQEIEPVASASNVVDLMAALKKSLGQVPADKPQPRRKRTVEDVHQTGLKLPIRGGKVAAQRPRPRAKEPDQRSALSSRGRTRCGRPAS